ncbi:hypothetical protein FE391_02450 [Nonomuraea sp. KC401]|uniref:DUF320 domain-containing protein n=1 Tax=Nonomuraea longispora TaxID=1848320 RepID=A0A4R4N6D5_9ACTN|nr:MULTISPECIES: hypothetical protein [Nonomuraea]NBE92120.1 hypothetical protein [Nonomuraea sp. K271]TDC02813.1 hypothetical protein E1267_28555 [Nonomuraea longispora]TLF85087.1 hypothetical protein FE391_02450 [Nonomuraea sp. KC401]
MKKLCVSGIVVAAATGMALMSAPAFADTNAGNASRNRNAIQSGNNFGNVVNSNVVGRGATGVNNVNGVAVTATHGGDVDIDDVLD